MRPVSLYNVVILKVCFMKRLTLTGLALVLVVTVKAQVEDDWTKKMRETQSESFKEFEQFKQQAYQDYGNFRRKANEEYAKYMEESWKMFESLPAIEPPVKPKPPVPLIDDEEPLPQPEPDPNSPNKPKVDPIRIPDPIQTPELPTTDANKPVKRPNPIEPVVPNAVPMAAAQSFQMYGTPFAVHIEEQTLELKDASEKSVAKMWRQLSDSSFDYLIAECLQQRDNHNLCDWAYIKLTQQVAEKQFGEGTNEAVLMQMYLLTQSGYQARIGRDDDDRLLLLMSAKEQLYGHGYFRLDGMKFYVIDKSFKQKALHIYSHAFPQETSMSLALTQPDLKVEKTEPRTITSKRYPNVSVTVQTNKNLLDFYNDYPQSSMWNYYSTASMSEVLKESLYPTLRQAIAGKTELEAVNILLNFVQTGFEYATDQKQFGYERPLFCDEVFYYPYCDCEDRSILFSCLVRELLGLDVVLLNYPEHLATAVLFNDDVKGDYLLVDGKTYIICDPTFIHAAVGNCAPTYKSIAPTIVKI